MTRRERGRPRHPDVLTPTEWAVLDMLRHGLRRREIAERRGISPDAVKYHVANIAGKLGVSGTAALRHWPGYPMSSPLATRRRPMPTTDLSLGPIGQVSLLARDIARAEAFYRDTLGLPHLFTFGDLAFLDASGTRLFIRAVADGEWRPSSILYFMVDDIRISFAALEARGVRTSGAPHLIHRHPDSGVEEWMAFFEDTEGNTLAIMSKVAPVDGSRPAES
jgi:DNA-binding CsgD family transcriptional regulator/catechol 2,3-dioxygenase-like lactoylglutathione lyase family enzyme